MSLTSRALRKLQRTGAFVIDRPGAAFVEASDSYDAELDREDEAADEAVGDSQLPERDSALDCHDDASITEVEPALALNDAHEPGIASDEAVKKVPPASHDEHDTSLAQPLSTHHSVSAEPAADLPRAEAGDEAVSWARTVEVPTDVSPELDTRPMEEAPHDELPDVSAEPAEQAIAEQSHAEQEQDALQLVEPPFAHGAFDEELRVDEPHAEEVRVEEVRMEEPHVEEPHAEEVRVEEPHVGEQHAGEQHAEEVRVEEVRVEEALLEETCSSDLSGPCEVEESPGVSSVVDASSMAEFSPPPDYDPVIRTLDDDCDDDVLSLCDVASAESPEDAGRWPASGDGNPAESLVRDDTSVAIAESTPELLAGLASSSPLELPQPQQSPLNETCSHDADQEHWQDLSSDQPVDANEPPASVGHSKSASVYEAAVLEQMRDERHRACYQDLLDELIAKHDFLLPASLLISSTKSTPRTADLLIRLALLMAERGEDVLIIDANLAEQTLTREFVALGQAGLCDVASGHLTPDAARLLTHQERIHFVPCGDDMLGISRDPTTIELDRLDRAVRDWGVGYHRILIDVGAVDSCLMSVLSDITEATAVVVPFPQPTKEELQAVVQQLAGHNSRFIGWILAEFPEEAWSRAPFVNRPDAICD